MLRAQACPRCRGAMVRVHDVGDTYESCVQCGHVAYGATPAVTVLHLRERWRGPEAVDRAEVRRRQIRHARGTARRRAA